MAKDQRKKQKQQQKKAAKHKAKKAAQKKKELSLKAKINAERISEKILDEVDYALRLAEAGNVDKADDILGKLETKYPENANVAYGLGVLELIDENFGGAVLYFQDAVELDPKHIQSWFNLSLAFLQEIRIKDAIYSFRKVIELEEIEPEIGERARKELAELTEQIEKNEKVGLEEYLESAELFDQGLKVMKAEKFEDAISFFKQSLKINPNSESAHGNLAICHASLGEKQKALEMIDKALEIEPEYGFALRNKPIFERMTEGKKLGLPVFTSSNPEDKEAPPKIDFEDPEFMEMMGNAARMLVENQK